MQLNTIEELIADYRAGKMVILMDDEDRENEGDILIAAEAVTPEAINFYARYARGLICLTITKERAEQLRLPLMVRDNKDPFGTSFTVTIEASEGVTTGISAADRATTVLAAVKSDAKPEDIVTPGHIFPIVARSGGVLTRAGHTEAGCDLARLAGFEPASVIVEIMNEDGTMARRDDLEVFAKEHDIKLGTIADLIEYRLQNEKTVERVSECKLPTEFGDFRLIAYEDALDNKAHFALVYGDLDLSQPALVRVHMQDSMCDLLGSTRDECGWSLRAAMQQVAQAGVGVVVLLRKHNEATELLEKVAQCQMKDRGLSMPESKMEDDSKTYGLGARILKDLGLTKLKVIGSPSKLNALGGFGLEVVEYVEKQG